MTDGTDGGGALRVLGIAGSLRSGSYNRALLRAAAERAPEGMEVEEFPLGGIPLYDGDLENDERRPEPVRQLKEAIAAADAVLIATPEYNHGVPGVLKNAIDWASRPAMKSPFAGKPVAVMGAAPGALGTARAQQQLKLILLSMLALPLPHPGVVVGAAKAKFDADGRLTDEATGEFLAAFLRDLAEWTRRVGGR